VWAGPVDPISFKRSCLPPMLRGPSCVGGLADRLDIYCLELPPCVIYIMDYWAAWRSQMHQAIRFSSTYSRRKPSHNTICPRVQYHYSEQEELETAIWDMGQLLHSVEEDMNFSDVIVALGIARESPNGAEDPTVSKLLYDGLDIIRQKLTDQPDTYIMTSQEFAVFNYFQHHFKDDAVAREARRRYWYYGPGSGEMLDPGKPGYGTLEVKGVARRPT